MVWFGSRVGFMKLKIIGSKSFASKGAVIVAREIKAIEKSQSVVTPAAVVERARNPRSPLHRFFEWNDTKAAQLYREWKARWLICQVHTVDSERPDSNPVRAFVNLSPEDDGEDFIEGRGYVSTPAVVGRQHYEAQVLEYAKSQLKTWRTKFGSFQEFFEVCRVIDKLT